jgi:DNA polymerase
LKTQLAIVKPKVIVTLGKYAAQTLLRSDRPISRLRGQWYQYEGVDLLPTFHPAYLLRSPEKKREAWQDLQKVMTALAKSSGR